MVLPAQEILSAFERHHGRGTSPSQSLFHFISLFVVREVTFGGTNAPICHGSGLSTTTLSDLVVEVEYVDAQGVVRTVNDPTELQAASGAFGLLGVVVSLTLQLDEMGVVDMTPVKVPMPLAIPPPKDYPLPLEVQKILEEKGITTEQLEVAQSEFEERCERDYYLEWFWFPYQQDAWVNTWSSTSILSLFAQTLTFRLTERPVSSKNVDVNSYPDEEGVEEQKVSASPLNQRSFGV